MISFLLILAIASAMAFKVLPPMFRRGELRDGAVFSVMLVGGVFFSSFSAALVPIPTPLHLLVNVYRPFSQWIFSVMGWKS